MTETLPLELSRRLRGIATAHRERIQTGKQRLHKVSLQWQAETFDNAADALDARDAEIARKDDEIRAKAIDLKAVEAGFHRLEKENARLRAALASVSDDITHDRNRLSIVCTVWHSDIETTVDFIAAALSQGGKANG